MGPGDLNDFSQDDSSITPQDLQDGRDIQDMHSRVRQALGPVQEQALQTGDYSPVEDLRMKQDRIGKLGTDWLQKVQPKIQSAKEKSLQAAQLPEVMDPEYLKKRAADVAAQRATLPDQMDPEYLQKRASDIAAQRASQDQPVSDDERDNALDQHIDELLRSPRIAAGATQEGESEATGKLYDRLQNLSPLETPKTALGKDFNWVGGGNVNPGMPMNLQRDDTKGVIEATRNLFGSEDNMPEDIKDLLRQATVEDYLKDKKAAAQRGNTITLPPPDQGGGQEAPPPETGGSQPPPNSNDLSKKAPDVAKVFGGDKMAFINSVSQYANGAPQWEQERLARIKAELGERPGAFNFQKLLFGLFWGAGNILGRWWTRNWSPQGAWDPDQEQRRYDTRAQEIGKETYEAQKAKERQDAMIQSLGERQNVGAANKELIASQGNETKIKVANINADRAKAVASARGAVDPKMSIADKAEFGRLSLEYKNILNSVDPKKGAAILDQMETIINKYRQNDSIQKLTAIKNQGKAQ